MSKLVLDVGNCGPDFAAIRQFLTQNFTCEVHPAQGPEDTLQALRSNDYAMVLVNRKLDRDYSDGIEIVRLIKEDPDLKDVPVMLVTNYPEHQEEAMTLGAEKGFGKLELQQPETVEKVAPFLE